jgi:putative transposase
VRLAFSARPQKPSLTEALEAYARSLPPGAPVPTLDQARRALAKLTPLERSGGREGTLARRARLAYVSRDTSELAPTAVYIADGKTFDAEVAHPQHGQPFRPELTSILDVATRRCVGWSAALDESAHAVADALRRACGEAGIPALFYTDRGPGYRNQAMDAPLTGLMGRLGVTPIRARAYNSQAKGIVERFNHVWNRLARELPTYVGDPMDKEARKRVFTSTRRELALVGTSRLLPGWDLFLEQVAATIARYNATPHTALPKILDGGRLRHRTPDEEWAARCEWAEPIVPDAAELEELFRPHVVRITRRGLVEWLGNAYFSPALERWSGTRVAVAYDVRDASRVWVRSIDEVDGCEVPGRLLAIAVFEGNKTRYVPLSMEQAAAEKRAAGRLGRLDAKRAVIEQELRPHALIDAAPAPSGALVIDLADIEPELARLRPVGPEPRPASPSAELRPVFRSEAELAVWALAQPGRLTDRDRQVLREALEDGVSRQLLTAHGLDLARLRELAA